MKDIERRVVDLERVAERKLVTIWTDSPPTPEQLRAIDEAERAGQTVIRMSWQDAQL